MVPTLVLPDGRRIELDDDVVLGRAPIAPESSPSARSISLSIPTISKTHVLVGHDADGVWIIDLDSSNGSEVLDDLGMSERAVPGQRVPVPEGAHIRVGTDTIVTIDTGEAPDDEWDRTIAVPPAKALPASPAPPAAPVIPEPIAPAPSASQPPPPVHQPPPPQQQPRPSEHQPPPPQHQQAQPQAAPTEAYRAAPVGPAPSSATERAGRSVAHLIGAALLLVWSAVGFAQLRGWVPESIADAVDGRLFDAFFVPDRFLIEFFDFYSFISLPEPLSVLSRGADIGPVVAMLVAAACLVVPNRLLRWTLVLLVAIPLILLFGVVVSLLIDSFDFFIDDIDRFIPWFVLPTIGSVLVLWPRRRPSTPPTAAHDVFYAPVQPPEPPIPGPGAPPFA